VEHDIGALSQDPELKTLARTLGDVADTLLDDLWKLGENSGPHWQKCQIFHGRLWKKGSKDSKKQTC